MPFPQKLLCSGKAADQAAGELPSAVAAAVLMSRQLLDAGRSSIRGASVLPLRVPGGGQRQVLAPMTARQPQPKM